VVSQEVQRGKGAGGDDREDHCRKQNPPESSPASSPLSCVGRERVEQVKERFGRNVRWCRHA
jgi:hypothetical protein